MLDVLRFIFSSFWIWAGTVVLIAVIGHSVVAAVAAIGAVLQIR